MNMTKEGLNLIMRFEGFRARAYRDAVGIWTIGYGHTSMAGEPHVHAGLEITREEAARILAQDVERFAAGIRKLVKVPLSQHQFSALVSFAFNVGLGAVAKSSVLKAVNDRRFDAVPRRLNLWVKAGGRVLPGLVTRRAAEGALFSKSDAEASASAAPTEPVVGKSPVRSKSIWAALVATFAASFQAFTSTRVVAFVLLLVIVSALTFIVYDRIRKLKEEAL